MSDDRPTQQDIEEAASNALANFGIPNQVAYNVLGFYGYPISSTYTLERVLVYFVGMSAQYTQHFHVMSEAAAAFHNIGFDPRPEKP